MTLTNDTRLRVRATRLRGRSPAVALALALGVVPAARAAPPPGSPTPEGPAPASEPNRPEGPPAEPGPSRGAAGPSAPVSKDMAAEPWILRHRPRRNTVEVGVAVGVLLPSRVHELYDYQRTWSRYKPAAFDITLRGGFYPLAALGVEAEGGLAPTRTEAGDRALLYGLRGHVVGQLPLASVVPFVLVGGGFLGATGALGRDLDPAFHFGGGLKVFANRWFGARVDARAHVGTAHTREAYRTLSPEVLASFVVALGGPYRDFDRDGVPDPRQRAPLEDVCPRVPGSPALRGCPDVDGDGLHDEDDACPHQRGVLARDGCPELVDSDADRWFDPDQYKLPEGRTDRCPREPGVDEYAGCPPPDTDGDGINDLRDRCVDRPETVNGFQDDDGCPDRVPIDVKRILGTIQGIHFPFLSADLSESSRPILLRAAAILAEYPDLKLEIQGHTDTDGEAERNKALSLRRAESVRHELIRNGVTPERLRAVGYGGDHPKASNDTEAGRADNRRIEFRLLDAEGHPLEIPDEPEARP